MVQLSPLVLVLFPVAALAQTPADLSPLQRPSKPMIEAAQNHYLTGERFFQAGDFDAALVEFEASFRLSGEADLLFNLSWTQEKAGRLKEATAFAERYLARVIGTLDEPRGQRRLEYLKRKHSGQAAEAAPTQIAQAPPSTSNAVDTASRGKVPPLAVGLLAGGGALALSGIGCLTGAWSTSRQLTDQAGLQPYSQVAKDYERGSSLNTAGIVLAVTGGTVVAASVIYWAVYRRE